MGEMAKKSQVELMDENGRFFLTQMVDFCKQHDLDFYIVVFPYLKKLEAYEHYQRDQYESVIKAVSESGIRYLNLYDFYMTLLDKRESLRFRENDEMHPSERVHKLIAQKIYADLLRSYLGGHDQAGPLKKDYLR
jgi:lysophospholipase L1-like esterase